MNRLTNRSPLSARSGHRALAFLLTLGLTNLACAPAQYHITGGPHGVDMRVEAQTFSDSVEPLLSGSPTAFDTLAEIKAKETLSDTLLYTSLGASLGGGALMVARKPTEPLTDGALYSGISLLGLAAVSLIIGAIVKPDVSDHATVLESYNLDFPDAPLRSTQLGQP